MRKQFLGYMRFRSLTILSLILGSLLASGAVLATAQSPCQTEITRMGVPVARVSTASMLSTEELMDGLDERAQRAMSQFQVRRVFADRQVDGAEANASFAKRAVYVFVDLPAADIDRADSPEVQEAVQLARATIKTAELDEIGPLVRRLRVLGARAKPAKYAVHLINLADFDDELKTRLLSLDADSLQVFLEDTAWVNIEADSHEEADTLKLDSEWLDLVKAERTLGRDQTPALHVVGSWRDVLDLSMHQLARAIYKP